MSKKATLISFFPDHCLLSQSGSKHYNDYTQMGLGRGHNVAAHRMAYRLFIGSIPQGMDVMQTCENHGCINPKHLTAAPHSERALKGVTNREERHGEDIPNARLTPETVRAIRASNLSHTDLGKLYDVSRKCIADVRNKRTWKQVK